MPGFNPVCVCVCVQANEVAYFYTFRSECIIPSAVFAIVKKHCDCKVFSISVPKHKNEF